METSDSRPAAAFLRFLVAALLTVETVETNDSSDSAVVVSAVVADCFTRRLLVAVFFGFPDCVKNLHFGARLKCSSLFKYSLAFQNKTALTLDHPSVPNHPVLNHNVNIEPCHSSHLQVHSGIHIQPIVVD
jgi:hypothetical protein